MNLLRLLPALLLAACTMGLQSKVPPEQKPPLDDTGTSPVDTEDPPDTDDPVDTGDTAVDPACSGWFDSVTVVGTSLVVDAEVTCTGALVERWWLETEGRTLADETPGTDRDAIAEVVDLSALSLADGSHVLTLSVRGSHGAEGEVDRVTFETGEEPVAGADLVAAGLTLTPSTGEAGDAIAIEATVSNVGGTGTGSFQVTFWWSTDATWSSGDTLLDTESVPSLAAGSLTTVTGSGAVPSSAPTGMAYVVAWVDSGGTVTEDGETNNVTASRYTVTEPVVPDLQVGVVSASPTSVAPGATTTVSAAIRNMGTGSAGSSSTAFYWSSDTTWDGADTLLGTDAIPSVASGGSATASASVRVPSTATASGYVVVVADHGGTVSESDETDNTGSVAITVLGTGDPDLDPGTVSLSPSSAAPGETVRLTCTLSNRGTGASGTVDVGAWLSTDLTWDAGDTELLRWSEATISGGGSTSMSRTLTIPAGTPASATTIIVVADPDDAIVEDDETNNESTARITVEWPNLVLVDFSTWYTSVSDGSSVSLDYEVENDGTGSAAASWTAFYLSTDETLDGADTALGTDRIYTLSAGGSDWGYPYVTIPSGTAAGWYWIIANVDDRDEVDESDETDNTGAVSIRVY